MDERRAIGRENELPWRLPADLKHFKQTTMGHCVIMGRKTYESIGRALPGRENVIVTRNAGYRAEACRVVGSLEAALAHADSLGETEAFCIGGAQLYEAALPLADKLYITEVRAQVEADTYFPELAAGEWEEVARVSHEADEKNPHGYAFVEWARRS